MSSNFLLVALLVSCLFLSAVNSQADEYTQGSILAQQGGQMQRRAFRGNYLQSFLLTPDANFPQFNNYFNQFSQYRYGSGGLFGRRRR
ncbi:hypothetical protein M3Y97_00215700 [Aphelenchoides bicaudatus]|nr:hypothetical protein M3Y97_00215700 [Aphelenchoides bicaudatus]